MTALLNHRRRIRGASGTLEWSRVVDRRGGGLYAVVPGLLCGEAGHRGSRSGIIPGRCWRG